MNDIVILEITWLHDSYGNAWNIGNQHQVAVAVPQSAVAWNDVPPKTYIGLVFGGKYISAII